MKSLPELAHEVGCVPLHVLVVDDHEPLQLLIQSILTQDSQEFLIDTAATGAKAESLIQQNQYDLVLVDEILPDTRGCKLVEKFMGEGRMLPWILITGVVGDRAKLENNARRLNAQSVIWKSGNHGDLKQLPTFIRMAVFHFRLHQSAISTMHTVNLPITPEPTQIK